MAKRLIWTLMMKKEGYKIMPVEVGPAISH